MRHHSIAGIIFVMLTAILGGCSGGQISERPAIAVSFEPQAWMLRQIVGDDFDIITLLPAGSNPENHQPSISTMKGLGKTDAFFTLGTEGFEKSLTSGIASNFKDLKVIDCTEGVEKIYGTHGHDHHSQEDDGHEDEEFDPHMMASIKNSIRIARNITDFIVELYPEKAEEYRKAGDILIARLRDKDDSIAGMNLKGRSFAMRHPSLSYFAKDYGLDQIALQASGKEASPLQLRRQMEQMKGSGAKVFVMESEHTSAGDEETAKQLGLKTIEVSLNSSNWIDDLMKIANEINRH